QETDQNERNKINTTPHLLISYFESRLQRERVERIASADDYVLAAVEQKRFGAVARVDAEARVPERLAGERIVGDEVAAAVVAKEQAAGRAEQSHRAPGAAGSRHRERTAPADLAGPGGDRR